MTWWARRSRATSWLVVIALALLIGACARGRVDGGARPKSASLVPPDIALGFLQEIKSRSNRSLLAGETTIPPCVFTDKGITSRGEYRRVTGHRAPNRITGYDQWVLFKVEDPGGRDLSQRELDQPNAWNYSLRTPRGAGVLSTTDHCIVGPTTEPVRKVAEALGALGVSLAPEYSYLAR